MYIWRLITLEQHTRKEKNARSYLEDKTTAYSGVSREDFPFPYVPIFIHGIMQFILL